MRKNYVTHICVHEINEKWPLDLFFHFNNNDTKALSQPEGCKPFFCFALHTKPGRDLFITLEKGMALTFYIYTRSYTRSYR